MKPWNIPLMLCLAAMLVSASGCHHKKEERARLHRTDSLRGIREAKQKAFLVGKDLPIVDSILPPEAGRNRVVLLASGFDCGSCVNTGVKIIRNISSANKSLAEYMIEIASPMVINYLVYDRAILKDIDDRLHASIGYLQTPLILVLDGITITDMYLPAEEQLSSVKEFVRTHAL